MSGSYGGADFQRTPAGERVRGPAQRSLTPPTDPRRSNEQGNIDIGMNGRRHDYGCLTPLQSLAQPQLDPAPPTPMRAAATNTSPLQHVSGGGGRGLGCGVTKAYVEVAKPKTPSG